ncbi:nucleolar protein 12-domain-containing protein [Melanogaster broomeanus]|nr:nucleolar protein 12-domain-containing protein [Melanogaster broomeanus]
MIRNNLAVLTQSHKAISAKHRAKKDQIKEVIFDEDVRREFLTGFHKRKVAKKEAAKKNAKLREKEERLEMRREHRRALAERAAQNAAEIEKAYGAVMDSDSGEGVGIPGEDENELEEEFEGEEQLATVTVVEDFDPSLLHGAPKTSLHPVNGNTPMHQITAKANGKYKSKTDAIHTKSKSKKSAKVKYQTKAARLADRSRQRARRTEKAERAGGKASRKGKRR